MALYIISKSSKDLETCHGNDCFILIVGIIADVKAQMKYNLSLRLV